MAVFRECDFMCIVHPPTPTAAKQSARAMVEQKAGSDRHPMQPLIIGILISTHVIIIADAVKNLAHALEPRPGAYPRILPAREPKLQMGAKYYNSPKCPAFVQLLYFTNPNK